VTRSKTLIFKLGAASLALFAAILVYSFTRIYPAEILASIQATHPELAAQTELFGSAPFFFYTLALGLFIGTFASRLMNARVHCLVWIGLAVCLELTQPPIVAEHLSTWLAAILSESSWELIGPYWTRGAFDRLDLIATLIGGFVALVLLTYLPREASDARS
jgi:hypothetical protein